MTRLSFLMRVLAVAIIVVFTISIIKDGEILLSLPQTTDDRNIVNQHSKTTDLSRGRTSSSSWNIWIPFESTISDWSNWYDETDGDESEENRNGTSLFLWTPTTFKPKVSIVVDFTSESAKRGSDWMSRMAFAKMLQLEAKQTYGVETKIVVVGSTPWGDTCFPVVQNEITVLPDSSELQAAELEQEQWLGEKAMLLEASPGVWQDALYVLQQHYRSKSARYASEISLPHLRVDRRTPSLSEWKHLPELLDFLRVDQGCCTLSSTESSASVINFDSIFPWQQEPLVQMVRDANTTNVVLVGTSSDVKDEYELLLPKLSDFELQFVNEGSPGYSEAARYCLLQRAEFALLGSADSHLSVWGAMANHYAQLVRLVDIDTKDASSIEQVKYPDADPRSKIQIQLLSLPSSHHSTGSSR